MSFLGCRDLVSWVGLRISCGMDGIEFLMEFGVLGGVSGGYLGFWIVGKWRGGFGWLGWVERGFVMLPILQLTIVFKYLTALSILNHHPGLQHQYHEVSPPLPNITHAVEEKAHYRHYIYSFSAELRVEKHKYTKKRR